MEKSTSSRADALERNENELHEEGKEGGDGEGRGNHKKVSDDKLKIFILFYCDL